MKKESDAFRIRRSIALTSFGSVIFLIPGLFLIVLFAPVEKAELMDSVMPIFVILIPSLFLKISHYMQLVSKADDV